MQHKYQNKLPKGSQIDCFLEIVVHSIDYLYRFLENSEYAIRSCLCSPNSFPSTPDTPHSEPKTHPSSTKTRTSLRIAFELCVYLKYGAPEGQQWAPWNPKSICNQLFVFGLSSWDHNGRLGAYKAHPQAHVY